MKSIVRNKMSLFLTGAIMTAGLSAVSLAQPGSQSTENASVSHAAVVIDLLNDRAPVPNASSVLHRNRHGVTISFNTTGLEPNAAHTFWLLVFNRPEFCTRNDDSGLLCDSAVDEHETIWGGGRISDEWGQINLDSTVIAGDELPGLLNSQRAEIHIIARSHGPAANLQALGQLEDALTTPGGGCASVGFMGSGRCANVQAAGHAP